MENKTLNLIKDALSTENIVVDSVKYLTEDNIKFLRITIDKEGFITSDDCVKATKIINPILDDSNLIEESYILDVCSKERG